MEITAAVAADLALLTQALDEDGADIAETLLQLAADTRLAVRSYLGLTVATADGSPQLTFTIAEPLASPDDVVSSLLLPLFDGTGPPIAVIMYAARPGAFVDLAADLSWLTGNPLADYLLDQHVLLPSAADTGGGVRTASVVDQAIGVLLGRGYTPERATVHLDARAATAGTSRSDVAAEILDTLRAGDADERPARR